MPRNREFNPDALIDSALDLFWRKGYKSCSMADVVKQTGVARYGLYQTFKDKDQLYCATLKRYGQKMMEFLSPLKNQRKSGFNALVEHFDELLEMCEDGVHEGCYAHQAALERAASNPEVGVIVDEIFDNIKAMYRHALTAALRKGEVRQMPLDALVNYVMGIQRAVLAMTKQNCSMEERREYIQCSLALLRPENPTSAANSQLSEMHQL